MNDRTLLPRAWRRDDIERQGLPRYAADDLDAIKTELRDGAGFVLASGIEPADLERFGDALGRPLAQNAAGERLVQIADFSDIDAFDDRGYRSPGELNPHTDPPPLIVLLCQRAAKRGGTNMLVSAESIRDAIGRESADLLAVLAAGLPFFMPDEKTPGGGSAREPLPILLDGAGGLSCVYYRPFIERAAEVSGAVLPAEAVAALDLFDRCATDPALRIEYALRPGETLILNNYRVLHARDAFEDWPEKAKRRCLLRLWLDADWLPAPPPAHAGRRDPMAALL
ncbi:MAG: TauD/TfdA family dioxygenase [Alphaproteobacteria bacterium]